MKFLPLFLAFASFGSASAFGQDSTPPQAISTASADGLVVGIAFNEALDPATANDPAKYTLGGGATVSAATLQEDGTTVALDVTGLTGATFSLTINGVTDLSGNAFSGTLSGQVLGFTVQDLGIVEAPGRAFSTAPGSADVYARGRDIFGTEDSGHFIWEERTGDFDVRVRLESFTGPSVSANAGLMARETADASSRNIQVVTYSNQKLWVSALRPETAGITVVTPGAWSIDWPTNSAYPNIWLRLKRVGNTFTMYGGTNGTSWVQVGDSVIPATPYPDTILVGMRTTPVEVQVAGSTAVAKYRDYGAFAITNATINIIEQPANATVRENQAATFSVTAEVPGVDISNVGYQWQKDGVDIPGATARTYTTPVLMQAESGAKYRVRLTLPGAVVSVTSQEATVTVVSDEIAPSIVSAASLDGMSVGVCFDEALDPATVNDPSMYTLSGGVSVLGAILEPDGMTVSLFVSGISGSSFTLNVNGVTDLAGNVVNGSVSGEVLGFTAQDLGFVELPGRASSCAPGSFDVSAHGLDIWGFADSGHLVWKEITGNFDVRVRVESFNAPAPDANAGLMAREIPDAGSRNISVVVYANQRNWTATQREETDGISSVLPGDWRINWPEGAGYPNIWLRLKREGNNFTTYGGTNGVDWTQIGESVTPEVPYADTLLVGLRTTPVEVEVAGSTAVVKYRDYGTFSITNASINILEQPANVSVVENSSVTFSVDAEAIGASSSNLSYQWQRDGVDITGATTASFSIAETASTDNGAKFRVRISLPGGTTVLSQEATLTVTEDLTAPAIVSASSLDGQIVGIRFNERLDEITANDPARYTVSGAVVTSAMLQPDGKTVVLFVSGLAAGGSFTVNVNGVTDVENNAATGSSTGQVQGLTASDLGIVGAPGLAYSFEPGSADVSARGLDIWGFADSGHFIWEERTGDFDVKVRLESFTAPATSANAGLMARESLEAGSRNVQIVTYANQQLWVSAMRAETDGESAVTPGDWDISWPAGSAYPNIWLRLKRVGDTFTTFGSINGVDWLQVGDPVTPAPPYPATILVGMRTTPVEVQVPDSLAVAQYRDYGDFVEVSVPELAVSMSGDGEITVSWPADAQFTLESTTSLSGAAWAPVGTAPEVQGGSSVVHLTVEGGSRFFRLRQ